MSNANNIFRPVYRELNEEEKKDLKDLKDKAQDLYLLIENIVQENPSTKGRYVSLAKTKLEESIMWAVKGITL